MGQTRRQQRQRKHQDRYDDDPQDVPMAQPDRSGPKGTTLLQLAEEREAELWARADAANAARGGRQKPSKGQQPEAEGTAMTPREEQALTAVFHTASLAMLHFTLSVLAHHQYAADLAVPWSALAWDTAWPFSAALLVVVWLAHTATAHRVPALRQAVLAALAAASGVRLVRIGNQEPYLAVMRGAPPVGALWVWAVVELRLAWAVGSLGVVGVWVWIKGYGLW